jgi:hypothetical protein
VTAVQVDLVASAVEAEWDCLGGVAAVDVIDEEHIYPLCHLILRFVVVRHLFPQYMLSPL